MQGETPGEIGEAKGHACNKNKISVYFDNDPDVLAGFSRTSKISRVLVLPQDSGQDNVKPRHAAFDRAGIHLREIDAVCTGLEEDSYICPVHGEVHG